MRSGATRASRSCGRADETFLGYCGPQPVVFTCPLEGTLEIGWGLAPHAWGAGYVTEAARAVIGWLWRTTILDALYSYTTRENCRSQAVMARAGFLRTPDLDFDHPRLAADDPLRPQMVYALPRPEGA